MPAAPSQPVASRAPSGSSRYSWFSRVNMPTMASEKARKARLPTTSRQSPRTPLPLGSTLRAGRTRACATVSTAKMPAAVSAEVRKSTRSRALPSSGPTSAPVVANTLNRANASALRSPASCAR